MGQKRAEGLIIDAGSAIEAVEAVDDLAAKTHKAGEEDARKRKEAQGLLAKARLESIALVGRVDPFAAILSRDPWALAKWIARFEEGQASEAMGRPLCLAAALGWSQGVRIMVEAGCLWWREGHGAQMNRGSRSNAPALPWWSRSRGLSSELFSESSADKFKSLKKNAEYTALSYAALNGHVEAAQILTASRRRWPSALAALASLAVPGSALIANLNTPQHMQTGCARLAIQEGEDAFALALIDAGAGSQTLQEEVVAAIGTENQPMLRTLLHERLTPSQIAAWGGSGGGVGSNADKHPALVMRFLLSERMFLEVRRLVDLGADGRLPGWSETLGGSALHFALNYHHGQGVDQRVAVEVAKGTTFPDREAFNAARGSCKVGKVCDILDARHPEWAVGSVGGDMVRPLEEGEPREHKSARVEQDSAALAQNSQLAVPKEGMGGDLGESARCEKARVAFEELEAFEELIREMSNVAQAMRSRLESVERDALDGPSSGGAEMPKDARLARERLAKKAQQLLRSTKGRPSGLG